MLYKSILVRSITQSWEIFDVANHKAAQTSSYACKIEIQYLYLIIKIYSRRENKN